MDDRILIYGFALPLAIGAALVLPAAWRAREPDRTRGPAWALMLAIASSTIIALLVWEGENRGSWDWQLALFLPLLGMPIIWLRAFLLRRVIDKPVGVSIVTAGVMAIVVTGVLWRFMEPDPWLFRAVPGLGTFVLLVLLEPLGHYRPPAVFVLVVGLSAAGCTLVAFGGAMIGLVMGVGALGMPLLAYLFATVWRRHLAVSGGPLLVIVPLLIAAPYITWRYNASYGMTAPVALYFLPSLAPLLLWVAVGPAWVRLASAIFLVLAACAASAGATGAVDIVLDLIGVSSEEDGGDYEYDPGPVDGGYP